MSYVKVEFVCHDAATAMELISAGAELGLVPTDPVTNTLHSRTSTTTPAQSEAAPDGHWPQDDRTYNSQDLPSDFNPNTDVDEKGFIYNAEIHASTKTTTKQGFWKRKQGVTKDQHDAQSVQYTPQAPAPQTETMPQTMPDGRPITGRDAYGNPIVTQNAPMPQTETTQYQQPAHTGVPGMQQVGGAAPGVHQAAPLPSQRTYASFTDALDALNEVVQAKHKEGKLAADPNAANSVVSIYNRAGVDMGMFEDVARQQNDLAGCLQEIFKALRAFEVL